MYCSICGNKLADNALFCPNCGTKVETAYEAPAPTAAPVVEAAPAQENTPAAVPEVKAEQVAEEAPVEETPAPASEPAKEETPAAEVVAEEAPAKEETPAAEVVAEEAPAKEETPAAETAPAAPAQESAPSVEPEVKSEPVAEAAPAPAPAPSKKAAKADKPKKKGKGCLIAAIIIVVLLVIAILLAVIIVGVLILFSNGTIGGTKQDYSNCSAYYGDYQGTSTIVSTSGSQELLDYLDENGQSIDINALYTDKSESPFAISLYDDSDISPASWDLMVDMGEYFEYQRFNNRTFITYSDFGKGKYESGDLIPNETGYFVIEVEDTDSEGYMSENLFGINDKDGKYKMTMEGFVNGDYISGTLNISFYYGDMEHPYSEEIEFSAIKK